MDFLIRERDNYLWLASLPQKYNSQASLQSCLLLCFDHILSTYLGKGIACWYWKAFCDQGTLLFLWEKEWLSVLVLGDKKWIRSSKFAVGLSEEQLRNDRAIKCELV